MKTLLLVRHGQTEANRSGNYVGDLDGLTQIGHQQSWHLGLRLQSLPIDMICLSGSARTEQTLDDLKIFLPTARVKRVALLAEGSVGLWEGARMGRRRQESLELGVPEWQVRPPKGESWLDIDCRVEKLLERFRRYRCDTVLIIGHGRINSLFLRRAERQSWNEYDGLQQYHTAVSRVSFQSGRATVDFRNDVTHLPDGLVTI